MEFKRSSVWGLESVCERAIGESNFWVITRDDTRNRNTKGSLGLFMGAKEEAI